VVLKVKYSLNDLVCTRRSTFAVGLSDTVPAIFKRMVCSNREFCWNVFPQIWGFNIGSRRFMFSWLYQTVKSYRSLGACCLQLLDMCNQRIMIRLHRSWRWRRQATPKRS